MILNWIMPKNRVAPIDIARELTEGDTSPDLEAGIEQVPQEIETVAVVEEIDAEKDMLRWERAAISRCECNDRV